MPASAGRFKFRVESVSPEFKQPFAKARFCLVSVACKRPLLADSGLSRWAANGRKRLVVPGAEDRGAKKGRFTPLLYGWDDYGRFLI